MDLFKNYVGGVRLKNLVMGFLAIILGLIVIAFPLAGVVGASFIAGFAAIILAIWFLIAGASEVNGSAVAGVLFVILGIIGLIIGFGLFFNPVAFAFLAAILLYLAGIILIIGSLISMVGGMKDRSVVWGGVIGMVLGIIYIILGTIAFNPVYLGFIIGIWLIITGFFTLFIPAEQ